MASRTKPDTRDITAAATVAQVPVTRPPLGARATGSWSLGEQLDLAIQVEKTAARIYAALAERFAESSEASAMFARLEQEEHQHALRIEMLGTVLARRPELQFTPVLDVRRMQRALRDGEDVAVLVADRNRRLPLTFARQLAAQLEEKFASVHAEQLTSISEPSLHELFSIFVAQDHEHAALLAGAKR
jgi:rubrerythrin